MITRQQAYELLAEAPPWSAVHGRSGDSDDYGDEQDRSDYYQDLSDRLAAALSAALAGNLR